MVVSLVYCGEGWLWFVVSLYFMCACVSFVELDLFVLIDSVFGIACFSQFFSFMVYHLFEVVFISFGGSVSILSITFCLSVVLRLSLVLWTKSVNSCLSLSNRVQFFISCVISVLIRAEFSSILLTSSLLVLIAAESRESATSFSASHHA